MIQLDNALFKIITNKCNTKYVYNATSRIILDKENNVIVYVILSVKENAVIKELSNNLQTKIKTTIKKASDLEVKEVNISVRNLQAEVKKEIEQ